MDKQMLLAAGYELQSAVHGIWSRRDGQYQIGRGPSGTAIMLHKPDEGGVAQEPEVVYRLPVNIDESVVSELICSHRDNSVSTPAMA